MRSVYTQYFQKSKVFLYPLLKLKRGISHVPVETYVSWDGVYSTDDFKFLCVYHCERDDKFQKFESKYLIDHKMLENIIELSEDKRVYIFNLYGYKYDFKRFIEGKYSKFSLGTKNLILNFFGNIGNISEYISSFLDPEPYHEKYAEALQVSVESIQDVYEVCSIPDLEKETLITDIPLESELLKNKYIYLSNNKKSIHE